MNGLVGAKNRGRGKPFKGKEKTNNEKGLKTEGTAGQPKEKRENKWIFRHKNNLRKKGKRNGLVYAKNRGWGGQTSGKKKKTNG